MAVVTDTDESNVKSNKLAVNSWILCDWAGQPFYTLVVTFLFGPYFAEAYIGDINKGQAYWLYAAGTAGLIIAFMSPILGAISDASGRKKPWIFAFVIIQTIAMSLLWFAKPGDMSYFWLIIFSVIVATMCAEFSIVFLNSMMPDLAPQNELGRLSGTAFAVGYLGGVVALIVMSGLIISNPETGKTALGMAPIIELDEAQREGSRFVGPFSALWLLVFSLPFFFFTRDTKKASVSTVNAIRVGLSTLRETFVSLSRYSNIMLFLIARLLYVDGLAAIFAIGAIYASGVFSWGTLEQGLFGIYLALVGALGAFLGGRLDDKIGPKRVIQLGLIGLIIACAGILSIDKTHILFVIEVAERSKDGGIFSSVSEITYLAFSFLIGISFGPVYSSSRTLMVRLTPDDKRTEFFGFFAFSGKVTSFLAPLIIGTLTWYVGFRIANSVILAFLVLGFLLLIGVKVKKAT